MTNGGAHVPSSSPELNLAEYGQGMVRTMLGDVCRSEEFKWRGNANDKMIIVKTVINRLNENKSFFKKLWDGHPRRCQWVIEHDGEILR